MKRVQRSYAARLDVRSHREDVPKMPVWAFGERSTGLGQPVDYPTVHTCQCRRRVHWCRRPEFSLGRQVIQPPTLKSHAGGAAEIASLPFTSIMSGWALQLKMALLGGIHSAFMGF